MKNKKNDGKYVIIDDGTAGGLFLSENEYYVDENKKVVLCNSEKKDNLFRKRYKLTHGDKCYSIIKYFCPEVEFISIKIMETGERGSIDSFKAALEWCLKEKIKLVHMSVGTTNYIDAKKIENIIKQMVSNKMILCAALSNTNFPTWPACFDGVFGVRNYIAKLQEKEISVSKSFPFSEMNSIQLNFDDVLKKIVGKEYKSNSFAAPIITVLLICYLRKNKKGSYQDAKKFIMNHINKCIYEKELEWNGIVNNKAWSIPIILTRTVIGAKLLYECFGKEDYECIVLTSEKNLKESCVAEIPLEFYTHGNVTETLTMAVNTIYNPDVLIIQTDKNIFESNSLIDFEVFDKKGWNVKTRMEQMQFENCYNAYKWIIMQLLDD